jgi:tripartite-type tricarboxylate transporter receptor subunit TctC
MRRRDVIALTGGLAAWLLTAHAQPLAAQDYPTHPVDIIVPAPPGSALDTLARLAANNLQQSLGQGFVVRNRAGDTAGITEAAKAKPDGYTLLYADSYALLILLDRNNIEAGRYPLKSFDPVVRAATRTYVAIVNPSLPAKSMKELRDHAAYHYLKLKYVIGARDFPSTMMGTVMAVAGLRWTGVPDAGGGASADDVAAGDVDMALQDLDTALPLIRSGRVHALAVTSAARDARLPDVPTLIESGYTDIAFSGWSGLFAPAQTPRPIAAALNAAVNNALKKAETTEALAKLRLEPSGGSPEEFAAQVNAEADMWWRLVTPFPASTPQAQQKTHSSGFPVFTQFNLGSIDGEAYADLLRTLNMDIAGNGTPYAIGFAGCHGWVGTVRTLDREQIKFESIDLTQGQPQGPCSPAQQKAEDDFLNALKQAKRWQLDQQTLILTWDGGTMRMTGPATGPALLPSVRVGPK